MSRLLDPSLSLSLLSVFNLCTFFVYSVQSLCGCRAWISFVYLSFWIVVVVVGVAVSGDGVGGGGGAGGNVVVAAVIAIVDGFAIAGAGAQKLLPHCTVAVLGLLAWFAFNHGKWIFGERVQISANLHLVGIGGAFP